MVACLIHQRFATFIHYSFGLVNKTCHCHFKTRCYKHNILYKYTNTNIKIYNRINVRLRVIVCVRVYVLAWCLCVWFYVQFCSSFVFLFLCALCCLFVNWVYCCLFASKSDLKLVFWILFLFFPYFYQSSSRVVLASDRDRVYFVFKSQTLSNRKELKIDNSVDLSSGLPIQENSTKSKIYWLGVSFL